MCLFGGAPAPAALPPPPPPPVPPPDPPKQVDEAVRQSGVDAKNRARAAAGMTSTDVTKGSLVATPAPGVPKTATGQ